MATFFNRATLTYNGNVTNSNTTTGELVEVLSVTKNAVTDSYSDNDNITYVVSVVNSGTTDINGLTLTDNLGAYSFGETETRVPLSYTANSVNYYVNGAARPALAADVNDNNGGLVITGINVPAGGSAVIVYETTANRFAPLAAGSQIVNTAVLSGNGIAEPIEASDTITADDAARLSINKALSPTTVSENGQLTYTFTIQNTGNAEVTATDDTIITDTFNPILNPITVTFNGNAWTEGTNYSYDTTTGQFATLPGQITVPAATFTQDPVTGEQIVNPGVSVLTVTGTV